MTKKIFEYYTGNAMLNNALMTIEALGQLQDVSDITPKLLLELFERKDLIALNKRLKSYTMLFTKNGPLHNDNKNGVKVYEALFKEIVANFENEGEHVCEISGLRFNLTFDSIFSNALRKIGISEKDIKEKDTTLNRNWFPLIGGLGSDAQALPQAKFTIQINPICIAILQFLPLSALLYKGGILLIDSSNFEFAKGFISENQKVLAKRIETTKSTDSIENVRDFSKGHYLLKAIKILEEKEFEDEYSDLNLWSFSNSGTGASCEIDRVPNSLIKKLIHLYNNAKIRTELVGILKNNESAYSFLSSLEDNAEWWLLYPNVFGSGKKKVEYDGVTVDFLETYFKEIGHTAQIEYAKYLAYLIHEYKTKSFDKYLSGNTSAWNEKEYRTDLYTVLVEATKSDKWNMYHQLQIIDNPDHIPIKNIFYKIHRLTHFYYQKNDFSTSLPLPSTNKSKAKEVCDWLIALIQHDVNNTKLVKELIDTQDYSSVGYSGLMLRASNCSSLNLKTIAYALYDQNFTLSKIGINELLRLFFNQSKQDILEIDEIKQAQEWNNLAEEWFEKFNLFALDYQAYYFEKYENKETGHQPYGKFLKLVNDISLETSKFLYWFREAIENTNGFLNNEATITSDKWTEDLLYNPQGEFTISFAKLAIKFSLLKQYQHKISEQTQTIIS